MMTNRPLQTMAWAYRQICAGEDPWTALGNFANAWYDYAKDDRSSLVEEPLLKSEIEVEHTLHWGAFCAASVEFLCARYHVPCPLWVQAPEFFLSNPWYGDTILNLTDAIVLQHRVKMTPEAFVKRNVFCGNRLYQNKYEMNEWFREALREGLNEPQDIRHYIRKQEIAFHGA